MKATKKVRVENTQDNIGNSIKIFKSDFEVYEFLSGYFGICLKGGCGGNVVWGGDSTWEDCYNKQLAKDILAQWDGVLVYTGETYGYKIEM